jgi:hypothetical protein
VGNKKETNKEKIKTVRTKNKGRKRTRRNGGYGICEQGINKHGKPAR